MEEKSKGTFSSKCKGPIKNIQIKMVILKQLFEQKEQDVIVLKKYLMREKWV